MRRTARGLGLVLVAATFTLASCRGDRSTRPGDLVGSSPATAWSQPRSSRHARPLLRGPSVQRLPLNGASVSSGLGTRTSLAIAPGDSTNDICQPYEWCGLQGDVAGGLVGVSCVDGAGACGAASYLLSIRGLPPKSTSSFSPNPVPVDEPSELLIQTSDSTPPGVYQSTIVITPVGSSPPSQPDTLPITVHVLCNFRLSSCPEIEIVDLMRGPDVVVSAPKPRQDTFIGKLMKLRVRHKAGTGTGQYTLSDGTWGIAGEVVKSYNIRTGELTLLTAADGPDSLAYYYVVSNNAGEYPVLAWATLTRTDNGSVSQPRTSARYRAAGPEQPNLVGVTTPEGPTVEQIDLSGTVALTFGDTLGVLGSTAGIRWTFSASMPGTYQGYVSATQLVRSDIALTISPFATPPLPTPFSTAGTYWLDSCPLYGNATQGGMFGPFLWTDNDSPHSKLTSQLTRLSRTDDFRIFFMYRPTGAQAIWVPLGNLSWGWQGTAVRDTSALSEVLRGGWGTAINTSWSANPRGQASAEFPQWTMAIPFPQQECPAIPQQ